MEISKVEWDDVNDLYKARVEETMGEMKELDEETQALIKELFRYNRKGPPYGQTESLFSWYYTKLKYDKIGNQKFVKEVILTQSIFQGSGDGFLHKKIKLKIENGRLTRIKNGGFSKENFSQICLLIHEISPFQLIFNTNKVDIA